MIYILEDAATTILGVVVMILVKVKKKKSEVSYSIVDMANEVIDEGTCSNIAYITDRYYDMKDEYGAENVKMIFV